MKKTIIRSRAACKYDLLLLRWGSILVFNMLNRMEVKIIHVEQFRKSDHSSPASVPPHKIENRES